MWLQPSDTPSFKSEISRLSLSLLTKPQLDGRGIAFLLKSYLKLYRFSLPTPTPKSFESLIATLDFWNWSLTKSFVNIYCLPSLSHFPWISITAVLKCLISSPTVVVPSTDNYQSFAVQLNSTLSEILHKHIPFTQQHWLRFVISFPHLLISITP